MVTSQFNSLVAIFLKAVEVSEHSSKAPVCDVSQSSGLNYKSMDDNNKTVTFKKRMPLVHRPKWGRSVMLYIHTTCPSPICQAESNGINPSPPKLFSCALRGRSTPSNTGQISTSWCCRSPLRTFLPCLAHASDLN